MTEHALFVYPGQPFIEDGIVTALLAFLNAPLENGQFSPVERECASRSVVATMVAVESIKKYALNLHDKPEGKTLRNTLSIILEDKSSSDRGLGLWDELRILRNGLVHASLFYDSTTKSEVSKATQHRLEIEISKGMIDKNNNETLQWKLAVNPLRVTRYEALVALTFFYWLGISTGVWKTGIPFGSASVDRRLKDVFNSDWMSEKKYHRLLTHTGDMKHFLGYLAHRLPAALKKHYFNLTNPLFRSDLEFSGKLVIDNSQLFN